MEHVDLPAWLEILRAVGLGFGPFLLFLSALIAAIIAWRAYRQRKEADERAEWWRRAQWAIDCAIDRDEERAIVGLEALTLLAASPLASAEDRELLETLSEEIVAARAARSYYEKTGSDSEAVRFRRRFLRARRGEGTP